MRALAAVSQPSVRRALAIALRAIVGFVFIYASLDKIVHPDRFAEIVGDYQLLPDALVNPFAVTLPWIELLAGMCVITGRWLPGAALLATGMTVMFMLAVTHVILRGASEFHCGCFTTTQEGGLGPVQVLWRDAWLLAACAALLALSLRGGGREGDRPAPGQSMCRST
jgi:uncharacterized membrane protein YphA (DoxX/SURF4 family)